MSNSIALAAALAAAFPAASAAEPQHASVAVQTADLDLGGAEGRAVLDLRLRNAVRTVCGRPFADSEFDLGQRRRCRILTMRAARRDARVLVARIAGGATLAAR